MKRVKEEKINIQISFTPRRLKLGHSYGYDKPKFYTTFYTDTSLDPHWAAEQLARELLIQLRAHADQIVAKRKEFDGRKYV